MLDYKEIKDELKVLVKGEIFDDTETLKKYSRDASLFEVWPKLVIWPKDTEDIKNIVKFVSNHKPENNGNSDESSGLSITIRAAGSCMSGGSLNESIILDISKYFNKFKIDAENKIAEVEPGVFYRDFEPETLKHNLILPCYTASKNLCALGGMIGNNSAGEKTLRYGNMENFVAELEVVLKDGEVYTFNALSMEGMRHKSEQPNFEGAVYGQMAHLLYENRDMINEAKPKVSKNSSGYYLWNVQKDDQFDLTKILVGSQGTLGIVTKAKIKLEPVKTKSKLLVIFMHDTERLGDLVNVILSHKPESLESYDDATLKLAVRFLPEMIKIMKANILKLLWGFLPELWMSLTGSTPKMVLMVEFAGQDEKEINQSVENLKKDLASFDLKIKFTETAREAEKYWTIRHESFNLLRKHVKGGRTVPFMDDVCVEPKHLPEFLPKIRKILDDAKLVYTIAGHAGNGNFHIIPIMDMSIEKNKALIPVLSEKIYDLVREYNGSNAAEHNDGIIRTPFLNKMYSPAVLELFSQTKKIFDPQNILNPGKKVNGTIAYMASHISK